MSAVCKGRLHTDASDRSRKNSVLAFQTDRLIEMDMECSMSQVIATFLTYLGAISTA